MSSKPDEVAEVGEEDKNAKVNVPSEELAQGYGLSPLWLSPPGFRGPLCPYASLTWNHSRLEPKFSVCLSLSRA